MNNMFLKKLCSLLCFYSDGCQSCDCVSTFTQKSGVYSFTLDGDSEHVYYSIEASTLAPEDNN